MLDCRQYSLQGWLVEIGIQLGQAALRGSPGFKPGECRNPTEVAVPVPDRRLVPYRDGCDLAVYRGAYSQPPPFRCNVQVSGLKKDVHRKRVAEAGQPEQLPSNLLLVFPGSQAQKDFLDDGSASCHVQEVVGTRLDPSREQFDPDGRVDEDHPAVPVQLPPGISAHLREVTEPCDLSDVIGQALDPFHAQGFFQGQVHCCGVRLGAEHTNRFLQDFLVKHKICAFHV